jgi:cobalt/nickel transport system permease protein
MHIVDQYAYSNRLTKTSPAAKAGLALWVIILCLGLNQPLVGLVGLCWMAGLAVGVAKIPARLFATVLLAEATFLLFSTLGIAISVSTHAPPHAWVLSFGAFSLSTTPTALAALGVILTRTLGATSALNFLTFTTPLVDTVGLLRRLHVPAALTDLMVIMYRFIFVLLETLATMITAQESRLGYQTGYYRVMQNAAQVGVRLFINASHRSRRLETALTARGYEQELPVLPSLYTPFRFGGWIFALITLTMMAAWWGSFVW